MKYSIFKEVAGKINMYVVFFWLLLMFIPLIYLYFVKNQFIFTDSLSIFTFLLSGIFIILFPLLASLIYLPAFSQELKNRFIVYTRVRTPIKNLLLTKFISNFLLAFITFFCFVFFLFIFSFYIVPLIGFIPLQPEYLPLNITSVMDEMVSRHTFTQLLKYGPLTYGFLYSFWVGINAAVYASIGFVALLLIHNKFVARSIPTVLYIVGSFILVFPIVRPFRFADVVFPFMYVQQPIWTALVPFVLFTIVSFMIFGYLLRHTDKLDDLQ